VEVDQAHSRYGNDNGRKRTIETRQPYRIDDIGIFDKKFYLWPLKQLVSLLLVVLAATLAKESALNISGKLCQHKDDVESCRHEGVDNDE
jgi:hypothetical protein